MNAYDFGDMKLKFFSIKEILKHREFYGCIGLFLLAFVAYVVVTGYFLLNTKTIKPDLSESCKTDLLPFCKISDDFQFEKFIHFGLDGVSWYYTQPLLDFLGEHAQVYTTYTTLVRYTQTIFRTWCTGRDNDNMQPVAIDEDTIFHSYNRTYGPKIIIGGICVYFTRLFKVPLTDIVHSQKRFYGSEPIEEYRAFKPWLYGENKHVIQEILEELNSNNMSLATHEGFTDHMQHIECAKSECTSFNVSSKVPAMLAEDLVPVKQWIDEHPDYLLIISADHGHDEVRYDEFGHINLYNHGMFELNNTGWWLFYNPKLYPSHRLMNITDVASTWMKYLKNVDIPANSIGRPMNAMRYVRNEAKVKQQALARLWNLCRNTTNYCKGPVYDADLAWKPGMVGDREGYAEDGEMITERERVRRMEEGLSKVRNIVSVNTELLFPENISVTQLQKIVDGRVDNPRKKVLRDMPTHYYAEFDADENGVPYYSAEKNGEITMNKADAEVLLNKYREFLYEANILHKLLYDTVVNHKSQMYVRRSKLAMFFAKLVPFVEAIVEVTFLCLILFSSAKRMGFIDSSKKRTDWIRLCAESKSLIIIGSLFIILYFVLLIPLISQSPRLYNSAMSPESNVQAFMWYDMFSEPFEESANNLVRSIKIMCILMTFRLTISLHNHIYKRHSKNKSFLSESFEEYSDEEEINNSKSVLDNRESDNTEIENQYSKLFYSKVQPMLFFIAAVYIIPNVHIFLNAQNKLRYNTVEFGKLLETPTVLIKTLCNYSFVISLTDLVLIFLRMIFNNNNNNNNNKKNNGKALETAMEERPRYLFIDFLGRLYVAIISCCFVLWLSDRGKNFFIHGLNPFGMFIISTLPFSFVIQGIKRRYNINQPLTVIPSFKSAITEFKYSWSLMSAIRTLGANSPQLLNYIAFFISFYLASPIHVRVLLALISSFTFLLLPMLGYLVKRLAVWMRVPFTQRSRNAEKVQVVAEGENQVMNENYDSTQLKQQMTFKRYIILIFNWTEIIFEYYLIHQIVEYLTFYVLMYIRGTGENTEFQFSVDQVWPGEKNVDINHLLSLVALVLKKMGLPFSLGICSSFLVAVVDESLGVYRTNPKKAKEQKMPVKKDVMKVKKHKKKSEEYLDSFAKFFRCHISTLFLPMYLYTTLLLGSLFLRTYTMPAGDNTKQLVCMLFCSIHGIGLLGVTIPLLL